MLQIWLQAIDSIPGLAGITRKFLLVGKEEMNLNSEIISRSSAFILLPLNDGLKIRALGRMRCNQPQEKANISTLSSATYPVGIYILYKYCLPTAQKTHRLTGHAKQNFQALIPSGGQALTMGGNSTTCSRKIPLLILQAPL